MEQQFSEAEKRFVLAEAIKKSTISVEKLFSVLAEYNVMPDWEHMLLPTGRDLSQCKHAFELLRSGLPSQHPTPQLYNQPFLSPASVPVFPGPSTKRQSMSIPPGPDTKRRKSGAETPTLARDLLPKPSNGSPMSTMASSPAAPSQKKRGRPSKADVERKQREAIERGDIIPPASVASSPAGLQGQDDGRSGLPPVMILPAPPARSAQTALPPGQLISPQSGIEHSSPATMSGEPPVKKRKPRPPPKPKAPKPGEHQFSINPPVGQAGLGGESTFTPVSTEPAQAGPIAAPAEAGNPPASIAPATTQDPAPSEQPKPDDK